jgi:hypothetical protein
MVQQSGHDADHLPQSSADVQNECCYTASPPYVSMACKEHYFFLPLGFSRVTCAALVRLKVYVKQILLFHPHSMPLTANQN